MEAEAWAPEPPRSSTTTLRASPPTATSSRTLFSVHSTGVSTDALVKAAQAFLDGLSTKERRSCTFDVDADEWTAWSNVDGYERKGVRVGDLTTEQRDLGYALLGAALSAEGLKQARGIMKLNGLLGESRGGGQETLTEGHYFFTFMSTPSTTKPWGFQFEGHHVAINYFVLGDQVVMTPTFMGSESTSATYQGEKITLFRPETKAGLAMVRSLNTAQRAKAGETKDDSAFYYRVHSPVVLIEYDAQAPLFWNENSTSTP
ncbi:DUF3500 domain-containing protein [Streptomyces sp. NPDC002285]